MVRNCLGHVIVTRVDVYDGLTPLAVFLCLVYYRIHRPGIYHVRGPRVSDATIRGTDLAVLE